jgi:hypothetical protein
MAFMSIFPTRRRTWPGRNLAKASLQDFSTRLFYEAFLQALFYKLIPESGRLLKACKNNPKMLQTNVTYDTLPQGPARQLSGTAGLRA